MLKVGELESQIDSFEAEIEGLTFKKGKGRPPRLVGEKTCILRKHVVSAFFDNLFIFILSRRPI